MKKKWSSKVVTEHDYSWCALLLALSLLLKPYVQCLCNIWVYVIKCMAYKMFSLQHISLCLFVMSDFFPLMWMTRQIYKQKLGLALRHMNGPRAGNWATLAMLEKYIDYQCFLWKDLQLKGEMMKENFHILRYGEVILSYIWFNLNFRLYPKQPCLWPIKHTLWSSHCGTVG